MLIKSDISTCRRDRNNFRENVATSRVSSSTANEGYQRKCKSQAISATHSKQRQQEHSESAISGRLPDGPQNVLDLSLVGR